MKKIKYTFLICLYSFYIAPMVAAQSTPFLEIYGWKYEEKDLGEKELKLMKKLFLFNAQRRKNHSNHPYDCMPMYKDDYERIAQKIFPRKNIEKHTVAEVEKIIAVWIASLAHPDDIKGIKVTCTIPIKGPINELFDAQFRRDGKDKHTMLFFEKDEFDEKQRKKDKKYGYGFGYESMKYGGGDNHINVFLKLSKQPKAYVRGTEKVIVGGVLAVSAVYGGLKKKAEEKKKKKKLKKKRKRKITRRIL